MRVEILRKNEVTKSKKVNRFFTKKSSNFFWKMFSIKNDVRVEKNAKNRITAKLENAPKKQLSLIKKYFQLKITREFQNNEKTDKLFYKKLFGFPMFFKDSLENQMKYLALK